jgi:hypothetical protein
VRATQRVATAPQRLRRVAGLAFSRKAMAQRAERANRQDLASAYPLLRESFFAFCRVAKARRGRVRRSAQRALSEPWRARPIWRRRPVSRFRRSAGRSKSDVDSPARSCRARSGQCGVSRVSQVEIQLPRFTGRDSRAKIHGPRFISQHEWANAHGPRRQSHFPFRPASRKPRRANDIVRRAGSKSLLASS